MAKDNIIRHWYTNDIVDVQLKETDMIPEGFHPGRKKFSIEYKRKLSLSHLGKSRKPLTDEHKKKISESNKKANHDHLKNTHYYNNGIEEKRFKISEIIPSGWVKGRLPCLLTDEQRNKKATNKNKIAYHKDNIVKYFNKDDVVPFGWVRGRLPLTDETKQKIRKAELGKQLSSATIERCKKAQNSPEVREKINSTKRKNGTFNTSKVEKDFSNFLFQNNILFETNYKEMRYPFNCDFYIPALDLFIELNFHYTHGKHPFNSEDQADIDILNKIKAKQDYYISSSGKKKKNSYFTFERIWCKMDPIKLNTAINNKLNYKTVYNIDEYVTLKKYILQTKDALTIKDLAVNGNDMLKLGYQGKEIGEALNRCLEYVLEFPDKNIKKDLIKYLKNKE